MSPPEPCQDLENLGKQLDRAAAAFSDACAILESFTPGDSFSTRDLASQIDRRLGPSHAILSHRIVSAGVSLARTWNKLIPPILRLPDEILALIFRVATRSVDIDEPSQLSSDYTIKIIYQRLYAFMGVCSAWRRVGLEGDFWSLVPVIEHPPGRYTSNTLRLCLERAVGRRLHFVACHIPGRTDVGSYILENLSQHGARFDSVNLSSDSVDFLRQCTNALAEIGHLGSIKELKLSCPIPIDHNMSHARTMDYLFLYRLGTPPNARFGRFMESLHVFQLSCLSIHFDGISLRNLTYMSLRRLVLGWQSQLTELFRALGSSSQLRKLEIISGVDATGIISEHEGLTISLPSLRRLHLGDISFPILQFILNSITQGSHQVTLEWTKITLKSLGACKRRDEPFVLDLSQYKIDTLILRGEKGDPMLAENVHLLLKAMPTITSLYLDSFMVNTGILRGLILAEESPLEKKLKAKFNKGNDRGSHVDPLQFAKLKKLYISRLHCHDPQVLRNIPVVASNHPLEELGIGVDVGCECGSDNPTHSQEDVDSEMSTIWGALVDVVPRLKKLPNKAPGMPNVAR